MIARKENKVYSVTEENKAFYVNQGFDILDEDGKVLSYGKGKTVDYAEYEKLRGMSTGMGGIMVTYNTKMIINELEKELQEKTIFQMPEDSEVQIND